MIKENKIMNKKILKIKNNDLNNRKMYYMKKIKMDTVKPELYPTVLVLNWC